jgi:two-component system, OmpR family, KDP operon response regulator KdpE
MMKDDKKLILLIEHDLQLRLNLRAALQDDGFRVVEADTGEEGFKQAISNNPDIVLLDLGLPDLDGLEVTKRVRKYANIPIIILSAREQGNDEQRAFAAGANDFLAKPFEASELLARIHIELRHRAQQNAVEKDSIFQIDNLRVDLSKRQVFLDNKEVHLTRFEFDLLEVFIRNIGRVITDRQLLKEVWGPSFMDQIAFLRVYMTRLRYKLREDLTNPHLFIRESGIGYRLKYDSQVLERNIHRGQLQLTQIGKSSFMNESFEKSFV